MYGVTLLKKNGDQDNFIVGEGKIFTSLEITSAGIWVKSKHLETFYPMWQVLRIEKFGG